MQIVIDIDEKRFRDIQRISTVQLKGRTPTLEQVISNGTPLPKGHGRLIDCDRLRKVFCKNVAGAEAFDNLFDIAPTIIEADKEGEEE